MIVAYFLGHPVDAYFCLSQEASCSVGEKKQNSLPNEYRVVFRLTCEQKDGAGTGNEGKC